ncbi:MAG: peptidoglycan-binding domain-containing protein [Terracidiphilus sp.]
MHSSRAFLAFLISAALAAPPAFATTTHRTATSSHSTTSHKTSKGKRRSRRERGQQAIDPERATQIQQALIREHYLTGDPSGKWDATTVAAMQKYQADHGWQTKLTPDSRALKSLGLGADYSGAINAQGASFASPPAAADTPASQVAGFTEASGVKQ